MKGFTAVELLVVLGVLAGTLLAGWFILKPLEIKYQMNDSLRLADLALLHQTINKSIEEASSAGHRPVLCPNQPSPCKGVSNSNEASKLKPNGEGWVKADLNIQKSVGIGVLPVDPVNDERVFYQFSSNSHGWEINAVLQSDLYKVKMQADGGDNDQKYEIGTNLTLIN